MLKGLHDSCSSQKDWSYSLYSLVLLNDINLDHEGKNSNILNGDFLNDHSEPLEGVFHMPLDKLVLWQLFGFTSSD